ncbi:MAG: NAD(P)H-dependent oxidoreductase [Spirochaetes bacterium]|uniref:NAD(P)H-dependent oxidoreductase n=1 Tax=Candidatus Ornithospirochaeta stercoripullorum TaxID=2840899 RepID=A0A9D9E268_9SPIO|nr:NAD(P)H-dependent oxidoreductase [Candidatus Ornithospirochaeta stercoripullorum]
MKKIVFIVGSLREKSFNRSLARDAEAIIGKRAEITYLDYSSVPLMNQDIEYPAPDAVKEARDEIMAADGIWIFSPEYNFNIPGGLKNLLDWLSRPLVQGDPERISALTGMPVTFSGVGGKMAASTARKRLGEFALFMKMKHMEGNETAIALSAEAFATNTLYLTSDDKRRLENQAERFLSFIGT